MNSQKTVQYRKLPLIFTVLVHVSLWLCPCLTFLYLWWIKDSVCTHFRALSHAESDFTMLFAISAAESESVRSGIDDRDLNYLGGRMYSSRRAVLLSSLFLFLFLICRKGYKFSFHFLISYHLISNLFSSLVLRSSVSSRHWHSPSNELRRCSLLSFCSASLRLKEFYTDFRWWGSLIICFAHFCFPSF